MNKFTKNKVLRTKFKKDKEKLCVIVNNQESVVDNKFWVMFRCNFRKI